MLHYKVAFFPPTGKYFLVLQLTSTTFFDFVLQTSGHPEKELTVYLNSHFLDDLQSIPAETNNHSHTHFYSLFGINHCPNMFIFGLWEETGVTRENPHRQVENTEILIGETSWCETASLILQTQSSYSCQMMSNYLFAVVPNEKLKQFLCFPTFAHNVK